MFYFLVHLVYEKIKNNKLRTTPLFCKRKAYITNSKKFTTKFRNFMASTH